MANLYELLKQPQSFEDMTSHRAEKGGALTIYESNVDIMGSAFEECSFTSL